MASTSKVPILNSPFLTVGVLDTALSGEVDPAVRIQLLSAKVHLLEAERDKEVASVDPTPPHSSSTTGPPASGDTSATSAESGVTADPAPAPAPGPSQQAQVVRRPRHRPNPTALLSTRVLLADAYLALVPPNLHAAEGECSVVEGECKRLMKVAKRLDRRQEGKEKEGKGGNEGTRKSEKEEREGGEEERPDWLDEIPHLRVRALRVMARVEEGLGREGRAERTRKLAQEIADRR